LNSNTFGALFRDALYQVLDDKVFRVLAVIVLGLVAATFLIGAREDGLVILFGLEKIEYRQIFGFFDLPYAGNEGAGERVVQGLQSILVDGLAGTFGIIFAVAATAFFVPRMLEKGAADTLFSKPVGRTTLLLSRYVAGLLFVGALAITLVGGMHVGFLVSSGYSDAGFLWSIVTLVYVFGLVHGVSILIGVLTRSTVASILLTLMFMLLNGCVHTGWQLKEFFSDPGARGHEESNAEKEQDPSDGSAKPEDEEDSVWIRAAYAALEIGHLVLPKTGDASLIAQKLRRDVELSYAELFDAQGGLLVQAAPEGWERRRSGVEALEGEGARWELPDGSASVTLRVEPGPDLSRLRAAKALRQSLESRDDVKDVADERGNIDGTTTSRIDWTQTEAAGERSHRVSYFSGQGRLYRLETEGTPAWRADKVAEDKLQNFVEGLTFDESAFADNPHARYANLLDWDADWQHNIFFSIGSSLAFLAAVLGLAAWRLSRIDF
jgi:ABC-type transport system involved in multi-copper enzyme maturation permease subunit